MKILGIDPGTATIGYGLIETKGSKAVCLDVGAVTTPKNEADSWRLERIYKEIASLIKKHKPQLIVLEKIFFSKNIKTAITVAQARGVIMLAAEMAGIKIFECSPPDGKMSVTGYGKADKKQVQTMVKTLLNLKTVPKPDDAADALAAALAGMNRMF